MSIKLSLIVAINNADRGIGIGGKLPWRISKGNKVKQLLNLFLFILNNIIIDLKHFQKITTKTVDISKKNAVIMGRLTWFSLPKMGNYN
jgi:dihydrofolate reductase